MQYILTIYGLNEDAETKLQEGMLWYKYRQELISNIREYILARKDIDSRNLVVELEEYQGGLDE